MLIVLGGLPGSGKTTIAREIAALIPCAYLRIDTIEQALRSTGADVGPAGYVAAYALARSNLSLGQTVLADCVNPLPVTREAWRAVAVDTGSRIVEVEIVCSDTAEHRRRVEQRSIDVPGLVPPTWEAVQRHDYVPWGTPHLVVDTAALGAHEAAKLILSHARD
ncbi:Predicted kinase [Variovorax sp. YR750]|uniref:AAA family ATPase n=1 Tax=Variovorax sp. YR750 TaxID=1884384 RepID=UPI0008C3D5CA|nr:AAA family ATPase [Variovorax sp. YR750]MDP9600920.1 putative kinase [Variovorax paradoxus]SEK43103.1 Predicted kinase [Variovorax sp. YR750]